MADLAAAPSINDPRTQAFLELIARLGELDLVPILVYRIDSVPQSALPYLAWQFDVLSPLWQLLAPLPDSIDALTNIDALINIDLLIEGDTGVPPNFTILLRELLKLAIQLHRFNGTPFALKKALSAIGWIHVDLLEGQASWGGNNYPDSQGWAVFRVVINLRDGQPVIGAPLLLVRAVVEFFKNARSKLDTIVFVPAPIVDAAPTPTDTLTLDGSSKHQLDNGRAPHDGTLVIAVTLPSFEDQIGPNAALYNSHYRHSGITYGANEPTIADSALVLNGEAVLHGG